MQSEREKEYRLSFFVRKLGKDHSSTQSLNIKVVLLIQNDMDLDTIHFTKCFGLGEKP